MDHNIAVEIATVKNRLRTLEEVNERFLSHVSKRPDAERLPSRLEVKEGSLMVDCFGHTATAIPRAVRAESEMFAMEYVFYAEMDEKRVELWRFYLQAGGRLYESPHEEAAICDYNNSVIADHICGRLLHAALRSALFTPAEVGQG